MNRSSLASRVRVAHVSLSLGLVAAGFICQKVLQFHRTVDDVAKVCRWRTKSHRGTRTRSKATPEFEGTRMSEVDEMTNSKPKSCFSSNGNSIGVGLAIGVAIGAAYGASSGNMAQSVAMGVALGMAFGMIFNFNQRRGSKEKNSQT